MPYVLTDLVVDRVDLVDEGANSAAFIELYKRKENSMNFEEILNALEPEHAEVVRKAFSDKDDELTNTKNDLDVAKQSLGTVTDELTAANDALAAANAELDTLKTKHCTCEGDADEDGLCKTCGKPKKSAAFDETETLKSMPEAARELFLKMRAQKEAAEEMVRKAAEEKLEAEAIAKANSLKALPVEHGKLVGIIKSCTPEVLEVLTAANSAIEATVLDEVGKNKGNGASDDGADDAWSRLEKKAEEIAARDSITKEKAMSTAISENPDLYKEYLNGGAN